ncbi:nitroreductase/quinone reductase family protein [Saccharothrix violaceirubra]
MDFNKQVVDEFRAHRGVVGGFFEGARLILLTTTGARSGRAHTVPLGYLPDEDGILVIGSAGGTPRHPAWYHNLLASPEATVEDGTFTYRATAEVLTGAERDDVWARAVEADAGWAAYQEKTTRVLPVVRLRQAGFSPPGGSSFGEALKLVHDAFRRELATIRREVAASGPTLGAQLKINCLVACQGLRGHHDREEQAMFPALAERFPEAAPAIGLLRQEHEKVAALIESLQAAVRSPAADRKRVVSEVDGLVAELLAHLDHEEELVVPLLDLP